MNKKAVISIVLASSLLLTGCGKSVEEQVSEGIDTVQAAFTDQPIETNTTEQNIALYLPKDFVIDPAEEENNFFINSKEDVYVLFVNENEHGDSKVNYDLLTKNEDDHLLKLEELKGEEKFGFVAVKQHDEKQHELIVSIGGVKLTTVTNNKKLDEKLANMIDIVRSVEFVK